MDDIQKQQREAQMELSRREMERKSLDTWRVYNPLDTKFTFMRDGRPFSIGAKATKDWPWYLARHYFKKISDYMIGQQIIAKGEELKAVREKQLGKTWWDKYQENTEIWDKTPRIDDPNLIKAIRDVVILGLVEEYGYDETVIEQEPIKKIDFRSLHDQLFDEIGAKRISPEAKQVVKPLKSKLVAEVTNE